MKILYFDTETTGIDPKANAMVQISGMIEIDGVIKETFDIKMRPGEKDVIDPKALEVIGKTKEEIMTYQSAEDARKQLTVMFSKYVDKFDRKDKFTPAGYNVKFDIDFLHNLFLKCGDAYFGSWVAWQGVDVLALIYYMKYLGAIELPNYKLETVCKYFEVEIKAHDALADITATKQVLEKIKDMITIKSLQPTLL